jgi:hypothetical protein
MELERQKPRRTKSYHTVPLKQCLVFRYTDIKQDLEDELEGVRRTIDRISIFYKILVAFSFSLESYFE